MSRGIMYILAPSDIGNSIRAGVPKFGIEPDPKIATLVGKAVP
jgi:hypothetical protein